MQFILTHSILPEGCKIEARAADPIPERFSSHLQNHLKKFKLSLFSYKADILNEGDDVDVDDGGETSRSLEFALDEFDDIPGLLRWCVAGLL